MQKMNTLSHGQYSQVHKMRTLSSVFRATCLEILKGLSIGGNSGNTHFVRCVRASLDYAPRGFQVSNITHCDSNGIRSLNNNDIFEFFIFRLKWCINKYEHWPYTIRQWQDKRDIHNGYHFRNSFVGNKCSFNF